VVREPEVEHLLQELAGRPGVLALEHRVSELAGLDAAARVPRLVAGHAGVHLEDLALRGEEPDRVLDAQLLRPLRDDLRAVPGETPGELVDGALAGRLPRV